MCIFRIVLERFCYFHRPLTSPAYPSLRGYRRAETTDGLRRRQSVIHMRAQMLPSLFLARHGSIHDRCAPVRCLPPPLQIYKRKFAGLPVETLAGAKARGGTCA
eukprot:scaffold96727_cov59-Phaeocystis_antarctica.AAC.4